MTGRIHIDLKARVIQTEKEVSLEEKPVKGLSSTFKVLPWLADFAFQRSLDYIQLFDLDLLLSSAAFDDNKAMENLTDKVNECGEYIKSMAIFDLDSLVGVNDNESISNMVRQESVCASSKLIWSSGLVNLVFYQQSPHVQLCRSNRQASNLRRQQRVLGSCDFKAPVLDSCI